MTSVNRRGYDKEAYEFKIAFKPIHKQSFVDTTTPTPRQENPDSVTYLLNLEGPFQSAKFLQKLAGLSEEPGVTTGIRDSGDDATFCLINESDKTLVINCLAANGQHHLRSLFARLSASVKDLSPISLALLTYPNARAFRIQVCPLSATFLMP